MKKFIFLIAMAFALLVLLAGCTSAPAEETDNNVPVETEEVKYDFRYANFGEDAETIKAREPLTISEETDEGLFIVEGAEYAGFETSVLYKIDPDAGFYGGDYWIYNPHDAADVYIGDFAKLKESITAVYGDPVSDKKDLIDPLGEGLDPGLALKLGYLYFETVWETDGVTITLFMVGEFGVVNTMVSYESKDVKTSPNTDGV